MPLAGRLTPGARPGWTRAVAVALSVLAILVATLHAAGTELPGGWTFALAVGEEALAEIIQNILLFIPLGLALGLGKARARWLVPAGTLLSLSVEIAQQWIPGRDPSLSDLLFNTLGTALGVLLARRGAGWLARLAPRAPWLSLGAALVAAGAWFGTGRLLQPHFPAAAYTDRWTPDIPLWALYRGRVLSASLGTQPLAEGPLAGADLRRALLAGGGGAGRGRGPLRVLAVAAPPPRRTAPLFVIDDARGRMAFALSVDRTDIVLRAHTRAAAWTLDRPDLRARGALAGVAPGDTFAVSVWHDRRGYCVAQGGIPRCHLGYTLGDGWRLIFYPEHFPVGALLALNALWAAGWTAAVGYWARRHAVSAAALVVVAIALATAPVLEGLKATPASEIAGAAGGMVVGWVLGRASGRSRGLKPRLGQITRP